jgi:hypothetical protein
VLELEEDEDDVDDPLVVVSMVVDEVVVFAVVVEVLEDVDDEEVEVFELETELVVEDLAVVVVEDFDDEVVEVLDVEELLLDSKKVSSWNKETWRGEKMRSARSTLMGPSLRLKKWKEGKSMRSVAETGKEQGKHIGLLNVELEEVEGGVVEELELGGGGGFPGGAKPRT